MPDDTNSPQRFDAGSLTGPDEPVARVLRPRPRAPHPQAEAWPVILCYCDAVKNITVSVPDDVYRRARIRAAELDSSVSALVAAYLGSLAAGEAEFARLEAQQRRVQGEIEGFRGGDRMGRDAIHDRAVR